MENKITGNLVENNDAVVDGNTNIATTNITPTDSKADTIVIAKQTLSHNE